MKALVILIIGFAILYFLDGVFADNPQSDTIGIIFAAVVAFIYGLVKTMSK